MNDQAAGPVGAARRKILIVDDEPDVVTYLETFFHDNGFTTSAAVEMQ